MASYIGVSRPLVVVTGSPSVNAFYGPYNSIYEAHAALVSLFGHERNIPIGVTVAVKTEDAIKEYWYNGGHTVEDLKDKGGGTISGISVDGVIVTPDEEGIVDLPNIPQNLSELQEDEGHQTVSQSEKENWDSSYHKPAGGIANEDLQHSKVTLAGREVNLGDSVTQEQLQQDLGLGTAATKNTGVQAGNVPVVGQDGKLDSQILPPQSVTSVNRKVGDVELNIDVNGEQIGVSGGTGFIPEYITVPYAEKAGSIKMPNQQPKGSTTLPVYFDGTGTPQVVEGIDVPENIHTQKDVVADGGVSANGIGDIHIQGGGGTVNSITIRDTEGTPFESAIQSLSPEDGVIDFSEVITENMPSYVPGQSYKRGETFCIKGNSGKKTAFLVVSDMGSSLNYGCLELLTIERLAHPLNIGTHEINRLN